MKYYAVIDTNVLISAMLVPDSIPGLILKHTISGTIIPLVNDEIIEEYKSVMKRPKFNFANKDIENITNVLLEASINLERTPSHEMVLDEKDVVFYEITLTARKKEEAYLITGNIKHFPKKAYVVTPKEMLNIIENSDII